MKLIIPVAGKGTRMRPFTHTRAKPLLPVAGKPVIDHIMDRVLPLEPTEVVFVIGHLGEQFETYVREKYSDRLALSFVEQPRPRGTAQAIWLARQAFEEDVLIIFSDTIFDADLSVIKDCEDDGIFWGMEVEDPRRFGVMVAQDGYLTRIVEKPQTPVSNLANIGLYYIRNTKLLAEGLAKAVAHLEETDKEIFHVDAFTYMLGKGARIRVAEAQGWYDTGTQMDTLATNRVLLDRLQQKPRPLPGVTILPPVSIDPTAIIEASTIGPHVSIGAHVEVRKSTIRESIIEDGSKVSDAKLTESILGRNVRVYGKDGSFFLGDDSRVS